MTDTFQDDETTSTVKSAYPHRRGLDGVFLPASYRTGPRLELRFAAGDDETKVGAISGYGSVFGNVDAYGSVIERGAFVQSLKKRKPLMLWAHNTSEPVGAWTAAEEDAHGLRLHGTLNLETQRGREALSLLKQGALNGLSVGFCAPENGVEVDRQTGIVTYRECDLYEVSIVAIPANDKARISDVRSIQTPRQFEALLTDLGFAKKAATALAARGWGGLNPDAGGAYALSEHVRNLTANLKSKRN